MRTLRPLLAAALVALCGSASAQNIVVSANVAASCSVSTSPLAFGAYDPQSASAKRVSTSISVTCVQGSVATVALDNGANFNATRRMSNGASTPSYIAYGIFQPASNAPSAACAYTAPWGSAATAFVTTAAPDLTARTYNVCGEIPAAQDVPTGSYTDTVQAVVTF